MNKVTCVDCGGSGTDAMDESMYCPLCDGDGKIDKKTADSINKQWEKHGHYKTRINL